MNDADGPPESRRRVDRFAAAAGRLPVRTVAVILGAAIGALMTFGVLQRTLYPHWGAANLDAEAGVWHVGIHRAAVGRSGGLVSGCVLCGAAAPGEHGVVARPGVDRTR